MQSEREKLENAIDRALGRKKASLVIRHAAVFSLITGEAVSGDIAISDDRIVGIGEAYEGEREIDGSGLTAVPGFIDAHVHVESAMVSPFEFERCVLPRGVTTAVCDPHELANVAGTAALDYFLECSRRMCMDLRVEISSCVPATPLETAGAELDAAAVRRYAAEPRSLGLAELMNVPGLLMKSSDILEKILAFPGRIDGHAPLVGGRELNACLAAGLRNCHECSTLEEATEKLNKGMFVLIREGSVARNLDTLLPLITERNAPFLGFCSDDRNPLDIAHDGHIEGMIARAIERGADPLAVYRVACWSPAMHFGLTDRGLIAPGRRADLVLLSDLRRCRVAMVIKDGRPVDAARFAAREPAPDPAPFRRSIRREPVTARAFRIRARRTETPVIGIVPLSLITEFRRLDLPVEDGEQHAEPERDIAKVAVLERYGKNGNIGLGFVQGFGLRAGAIASSVGHDSHNLCVAGVSDADMALAVNALIDAGGGFAVAVGGRAVDVLPLPIGGLMSERSFEACEAELERIHRAVRVTGCPLETPFLQLAFLPLPVIPFLRITDRGMVDVARFQVIES